MTKAELIRKIAKRAGVPDSEAKVFFEIFLKKSSELLVPGQAVFLKGFGHFQFKKGKIRAENSGGEKTRINSIFVDLMAYYPARQLEEEFQENLVFNIPALQFENFNPIDAYFSLSFGKPVIPIQGVKVNEIFIPLTGLELRKLVEAKVDKLIKELEIIKEYTRGSEVLIIDPASFKTHQLEFNWGEVPSQNISVSKISQGVGNDEVTETEISWDFGPDITKQLEEESILDVDKIDEYSLSAENSGKEKIRWDFGITAIDENLTADRDGFIVARTPVQDKAGNEGPEVTDSVDDDESFEIVRPISAGFLNEDEDVKYDDNNLSWDNTKEQPEYEKFEPETKISLEADEEEPEITETEKTVHFDDDFEKLSSEKTIAEEAGPVIKETAEPEKDNKETDNPPESTFSASGVMEKRMERDAYYSRRGTSPIFVVALVVIIAVSVSLYFYLRGTFTGAGNSAKEKAPGLNNIKPEIIKRDFNVPVTYPYTRGENGTKTTGNSISPKILEGAGKNQPTESVTGRAKEPVREKIKDNTGAAGKRKANLIEKTNGKVDVNNPSTFTFENLPPPADSVKMQDNVVAGKGSFTVQVSSWKSRAIALEQVAQFKSKGYDAFIEKAEIPGKGTWYRVKVRNFKTQKEAEDFLLSNQK